MIVKMGVAVDANPVASGRRPRKVIEVSPAEEEGISIPKDSGVKVSYSEDAEATWTVKGKQPHYEYKVYMGTDAYEALGWELM
jgi:hypothetical protein